jgi:RNA polymerase sigma factor (sigma-70 family)
MVHLLQYIRNLAGSPAGRPADGILLERFVTARDEASFTALVKRHGPLVWSVCQRVLRNTPDAEDAFQATFLVLARKAKSIRKPELLANWLYGVANRTARKAKGLAASRRVAEGKVVAVLETVTTSDPDLAVVLEDEVSRLPDKFRAPFVLCYLQGLTNEEAARRLGCPTGTILSRLSRARERLRARLSRRGLAPSALAAVGHVRGEVPRTLVLATVRCTQGGAILRVSEIGEGVLQAMFMTKLKTTAAVLLGIGLLLVPVTFVTRASAPVEQNGQAKAEERDNDVQAADGREARVQAAQKVYEGVLSRWQGDPQFEGPEQLYQWSRRWMEAKQAVDDTRQNRLQAVKDHLERMSQLKAKIEQGVKGRVLPAYELEAGKFYQFEAEQLLRDAERK